jgi:hypothetical protein
MPCGQIAQAGKSVCWAHDPDRRQDVKRQRNVASQESAIQRRANPRAKVKKPPVTVETLIQSVGKTMEQVRLGNVDANRGKAIATLAKLQMELLRDQEKGKKAGLGQKDVKGLSDDQLRALTDAADE